MTDLKTILAQRNFFTGQPGSLFNASGHLVLTAVDLSFNDFSGTIPAEVFRLPILRTFAAEKSCFHGSLPLDICTASSLRVLLMDGVTSGLACQQRIQFIGRDSNAYFSTNGPVTGGIPSCIWALPSLESLQLSSNSLTGTIAAPPLQSALVDVVLSFNQLTGTIPLSLQNLNLDVLKLSDNRLKGTFDRSTVASNPSFTLDIHNNRLSGFLPESLQNVSNLNVMQGNLFACDASHPKPPPDVYQNVTTCGSQELDDALYVWGGGIGFVIALVFFYVVSAVCTQRAEYGRDRDGLDGSIKTELVTKKMTIKNFVHKWAVSFPRLALLGPGPPTHTTRATAIRESAEIGIKPTGFLSLAHTTASLNLSGFVEILLQFLRSCLKLVALIVFVFLPAFVGTKLLAQNQQYSTHTFQYSWLASSTFLTGLPSAILVLLGWSLCCCIACFDVETITAELSAKTWKPDESCGNHHTGLCAASAGGRVVSKSSGSSGFSGSSGPQVGVAASQHGVHVEAKADATTTQKLTHEHEEGGAQFNALMEKIIKTAFSVGVILTVIAVIVGANALYLYVTLSSNYGPQAQSSAQVVLAFFKFLMNVAVIPAAVLLTRSCSDDGFDESKQASESTRSISTLSLSPCGHVSQGYLTQSVQLKFLCYVVNNMLAPVVVTIFADSSCLYDLLVSESSITEAFKYSLASLTKCVTIPVNTTNLLHPYESAPPTICYSFSSVLELVSTFYPPFTYSYQCSSAILTNYVPVMIYSYALQAVMVPVLSGVLFVHYLAVDRTYTERRAEIGGQFTRQSINQKQLPHTVSTDRACQDNTIDIILRSKYFM